MHFCKRQLPQGPCWYRYNDDGYGEHDDGSPFDGTGVGRPWPLLAGERAHYELAAGKRKMAEDLLNGMELSTDGSRLIPEQVWDAASIPERELFLGQGTGSACPLVWAHSEYIKLRRSLRDRQNLRPTTAAGPTLYRRQSEMTVLWMAFQQQSEIGSPVQDAARRSAFARRCALEHRRMENRAG